METLASCGSSRFLCFWFLSWTDLLLSADDDCDDFCFASSSSSGCFGEDREGFFSSSSCSQTGRERRKKSCRGNRDLTAVPVFHSLESLQKEANIKMG